MDAVLEPLTMNMLRSVSLLALASCALAAQAAPVTASYTVTGSAGSYDLNFTFANATGNPQLNLYFFGVALTTISGTPSGYQIYAPGYDPSFNGGPNRYYASTWLADSFFDPSQNLGVANGACQGGFTIHVTSLTAPASVDYFSYGYGGVYQGGDNFGSPDNPGFAGTAFATAVPGPVAALPFALMALKRRKRA